MTHIPQFSGTLTGLDTVKTKDEKRKKIRLELRQLGVKSALRKVDGDTRTTADGDSYTLDLRRKEGCSGAPQYFALQAGDYKVNLQRLKYYDDGKDFKNFCKDAINLGQTLSKAVSDPSPYISSTLIQDAKSLKRYKALREVFDSKDMEDSLKKLKSKGFTLKVESGDMVVITDKDGKESFEALPADSHHDAASKLKELIRDKAGATVKGTSHTPPPPGGDDDDDSSEAEEITPQEMLGVLNEKLGKIYTSVDVRRPQNKFDVSVDRQFSVLKPVIDGNYTLSLADQRILKSLEKRKNSLKENLEGFKVLSSYKDLAKRYKNASSDRIDSQVDLKDLEDLNGDLDEYSERFQKWQKDLERFAEKLKRQDIAIDTDKLTPDDFILESDDDESSLYSSENDYFWETEPETSVKKIDPDKLLKEMEDIKAADLLKSVDKCGQLKAALQKQGASADGEAKESIDALVAKFDSWKDAQEDGALKTLKGLPQKKIALQHSKDNKPTYQYNSELQEAHEQATQSADEVTQFTDEMKKELSSLSKRFGNESDLLTYYHPDGKEYGFLDPLAPYPVYISDLPDSQKQPAVSGLSEQRYLEKLRASRQAEFHQNIQDKNIEKLSADRKKAAENLVQEREEAQAFDKSWSAFFSRALSAIPRLLTWPHPLSPIRTELGSNGVSFRKNDAFVSNFKGYFSDSSD